jgi:uncharacterized protein (DUF1778 family)
MQANRRGRISAIVSASIAERLQQAAEMTGTTLDQFLVQAALEKANKLLEDEGLLFYSAEDAAMFIQKLDNPSPPNARLAQAIDLYSRTVTDGILDNKTGAET